MCISAALVCAVVPQRGFAQQRNFFEHYTTVDGLSDNVVRAMLLDRRGFLWVGTANGLNRYDGYTFKKYFFEEDDLNSLPTSHVKSLSEDTLGRIWIGCWGGVARFDPASGRMERMQLKFDDTDEKVLHVFCDSSGRVWLSMEQGLYVFSMKGVLMKRWRKHDPESRLVDDRVAAVQQDLQGKIWVSTAGGPGLLDEQTMAFTFFENKDRSANVEKDLVNRTGTFANNPDGTFFYGSWADGLRHFDPNSGKMTTWLCTPEFAGQGAFNIITGVQWFDGQLFIASHDKGLGTFDTLQKQFHFVRDLGLDGIALPTRQITGLLATANILWIASDKGLWKLDIRKQHFKRHLLKGVTKNSCLPNFASMTEVPHHPDSLLIPAWTCGIYGYNLKDRTLKEHCRPQICPVDGVPRADFKKVMFDRGGTLWAPSHQGMFREKNGRAELLRPADQLHPIYAPNYFTDVVEGPTGDAWAGTLDGIIRFHTSGNGFERLTIDSLAPDLVGRVSDRIYAVAAGPDQSVWFLRSEGVAGTSIGVSVYRPTTMTFEHHVAGEGVLANYPFKRTANDMVVDKAGRLWITSDRGLVRIDPNNPTDTKLFTTSTGLASDLCQDIVMDSSGDIWTASFYGVSVIHPNLLTIRNYGAKDGLAEAGVTSLSAGLDRRVYVGHDTQWLSVYEPIDAGRIHYDDGKLTFTSAHVNGAEVPLTDTISVGHDFNFVRLTFSPLNFLLPSDNSYRVEIAGTGTPTIYTTTANELVLSDLAPGHYGLRIVSTGLLSDETEGTIVLHVVPAFWQTLWFKALMAFLLIGGAALGVWLRFRALRKQQETELQLNWKLASAEMNALRSQMSPHFIFNALNAVNRFIWSEQPKEASNYLIKFSRLTRRVLENSREQWVSLAEDVKTLRFYLELESVNMEHGLDFNIMVADDVDADAVQVPPMLLQPFVENALKHGLKAKSAKGTISIHVGIEGHELKCTIEDDGVGRMETLAHVREGHTSLGTRITAERIEVINALKKTNARFSYVDKKDSSGRGLGTIVILYLPLVLEM